MRHLAITAWVGVTTWERFVKLFAGTLVGVIGVIYLFVLMIDPYDVVPFSLPIKRPIVSLYQRHENTKIVRSGCFDSLIVGTSTARLLDPELLDGPFHARFANLAMNAMSAWEQATMIDYFQRRAGAPKVVVVAIDRIWFEERPLGMPQTVGEFPHWLYDDNPWNDYLYLFNSATVELAGRTIGYHLGLYPERIRSDGYQDYTPPDSEYDLARVRRAIWGGEEPRPLPDLPPPPLSDAERRKLSLPMLPFLDDALRRLPASTMKILAYMPAHVAGQPWPGTRGAAEEAEWKQRIAAIARAHGAKVIDWRIASPLTRDEANFWDPIHYRLFIAQRLARELASAAIDGRPSSEGAYRLVVR